MVADDEQGDYPPLAEDPDDLPPEADWHRLPIDQGGDARRHMLDPNTSLDEALNAHELAQIAAERVAIATVRATLDLARELLAARHRQAVDEGHDAAWPTEISELREWNEGRYVDIAVRGDFLRRPAKELDAAIRLLVPEADTIEEAEEIVKLGRRVGSGAFANAADFVQTTTYAIAHLIEANKHHPDPSQMELAEYLGESESKRFAKPDDSTIRKWIKKYNTKEQPVTWSKLLALGRQRASELRP